MQALADHGRGTHKLSEKWRAECKKAKELGAPPPLPPYQQKKLERTARTDRAESDSSEAERAAADVAEVEATGQDAGTTTEIRPADGTHNAEDKMCVLAPAHPRAATDSSPRARLCPTHTLLARDDTGRRSVRRTHSPTGRPSSQSSRWALQLALAGETSSVRGAVLAAGCVAVCIGSFGALPVSIDMFARLFLLALSYRHDRHSSFHLIYLETSLVCQARTKLACCGYAHCGSG